MVQFKPSKIGAIGCRWAISSDVVNPTIRAIAEAKGSTIRRRTKKNSGTEKFLLVKLSGFDNFPSALLKWHHHIMYLPYL